MFATILNAVIWSPHMKASTQQEMLQRNATRFVFGDYLRHLSATTMLQQLHWQTVERRKDKLILVMFYKIINHPVDIPYDQILLVVPNSTHSSCKKY